MASYLENAIVDSTINWVQRDTSNPRIVLIDNSRVNSNYLYNSGTGSGKINTVWYSTGSLDSGGYQQYDLLNLPRTYFGNNTNISFFGGRVKVLIIKNLNTGNNDLLFAVTGSAALNGPFGNTTSAFFIGSQSSFSFSHKVGYIIGAAERYLDLRNVGTTDITYEIAVLGAV